MHPDTRWEPVSASEAIRARCASLWFADITYVPTWEGFLYVAIVLDAFSRRMIGWSMHDDDLAAELVVDALGMAATRRQPAPGAIHYLFFARGLFAALGFSVGQQEGQQRGQHGGGTPRLLRRMASDDDGAGMGPAICAFGKPATHGLLATVDGKVKLLRGREYQRRPGLATDHR